MTLILTLTALGSLAVILAVVGLMFRESRRPVDPVPGYRKAGII